MKKLLGKAVFKAGWLNWLEMSPEIRLFSLSSPPAALSFCPMLCARLPFSSVALAGLSFGVDSSHDYNYNCHQLGPKAAFLFALKAMELKSSPLVRLSQLRHLFSIWRVLDIW